MTTQHRRPAGLVPVLLAALTAAGLLVAAPMGVAASDPLVQATTGVAAPATAVFLAHGARTRPVVALTFDDGYNPRTCGALVDLLEQTATPATFFPNSRYVAAAPSLWRRIASLGFPVGNHTASHPVMPQLGFESQLAQIASDRTVLERVIGGPSLSVFRPPYGAYDQTTLAAAAQAGYPIVLNWDASFADSSVRPDGRSWPVDSYVRSATRGRNGSVILGHCGNSIDNAALPAVIAWYRAKGYTFVTVPQLLGLPGASPMVFADAPTPSPAPTPGPAPAPSPASSWRPPHQVAPIEA